MSFAEDVCRWVRFRKRTHRSAFAKASSVALRAMADKSADSSSSECIILMDGAARYLNDRHSALQLQSSDEKYVCETNSPVNSQFCKDLGGRVSESGRALDLFL